jgi:cytochrome o ubiquinol oxidase operon protein cyoD
MSLAENKNEWGGTGSNYAKGLILSFLLTLTSFCLVGFRLFSNRTLAITITILALIQAAVQLFFFLHVAHEKAPRWRLHFFYCMIGVLLIVAIGTLWIMSDLNSRMMSHMTGSMHP